MKKRHGQSSDFKMFINLKRQYYITENNMTSLEVMVSINYIAVLICEHINEFRRCFIVFNNIDVF